jgi:hypothetical protein
MASRREALLSRVAALPEELLPEIEQSVDEIVRWHEEVYQLSDDERSAVRKGMDAARRGDFAPDDEIARLRDRRAG